MRIFDDTNDALKWVGFKIRMQAVLRQRFISNGMRSIFIVSALALLSTDLSAQQVTAPNVKKSRQGICHESGTVSYTQTIYFESYDSLQACIDSGGRRVGALTATNESRPQLLSKRSWWDIAAPRWLDVLLTSGLISACTLALLWIPIRKWRRRRRLRLIEADAKRKWQQHRRE